jgi:signal transduction histidine kinase/ActR/RegA family two-component response regulator
MKTFKDSILFRFFIPLFLVCLAGVLAGIGIIYYRSKELLYELKKQESLAVLSNVLELVAEYNKSLQDYQKTALEGRKRELYHLVQAAMSITEDFYKKSQKGILSSLIAKKRAIEAISAIRYGKGDYIFVITSDYKLIVHPDPKMLNVNLYDLKDPDGVYVIRDLIKAAKEAPEGEAGYLFYRWWRYLNGKKLPPEPKLSAAIFFKPWQWILGTGVYLSDIKAEVEKKKEENLKRLCGKLGEMRLERHGYAFIFDQKGNMICHPNLKNVNIIKARATDPSTGRLMFDELTEAAHKPWGENVLEYLWDKPDDRKHYIYPKIAWCAQEPSTGWYVAISAYKNEVERPIYTLIKGVLFSGFFTISFVFIVLLLLLKKLLFPIKELVTVCSEIEKSGNLCVKVREDVPGEIGILARQLNKMIEAIRKFHEELEEKVRERTKELVKKTKELEEANERLKELDRTKSAFLSSVSHELRTPLTSVLGFAKLIHKDFNKFFTPLAQDDKKLKKKAKRISENLSIIVGEGERLTRLINDVLDLAKIESGRIEWNDATFNLKELLESVTKSVSGQFAQKPEVELKLELPQDLPDIYADRDRLQQVFINLLNNAAKFTEKGYVKLGAKLEKDKVIIAVEDTGCGIPKEDLNKVFDKFHQVIHGDTLKDKPKGTGLGLAICKQIIEHYNGKIWVESELGKGSKFFVELPIKKGKQTSTPTPEVAIFKGKSLSNKPLILVVDDDEGIRSLLTQILVDVGYKVITAKNGKEAIELAKKKKPDLITMDLMMPVMDGETAIKHLREYKELKNIPIIIVSVLSKKELPADAYLEKPIDEEHFLDIVHTLLLDKKAPTTRPCLVVKKEGEELPQKAVLLCSGEIMYCRKEEVFLKIKAGFKGTVIIPYSLYHEIDVVKLSKEQNVQVVIV